MSVNDQVILTKLALNKEFDIVFKEAKGEFPYIRENGSVSFQVPCVCFY